MDQVKYFLRMMWYLGFVKSDGDRWSLTSFGMSYCRSKSPALLLRTVERWYPALFFLDCVLRERIKRVKDIENTLGADMKYWTTVMNKLGFNVRPGIRKPYNDFVIKNLIIPLLEHVGLVVRSGGLIHATAQAQSLVARLQQQFTLVCFAPKDPVLFGAVYDLAMQSRHTTVVTTTIDAKTLTALDALSKLRPEAQVEVYTCNVVGFTEDTATILDRVSVTKI